MDTKPTLVIMAAGMGSRFGGNKQIVPVDDAGHIIIDFSIYDAVRAGFGKVVCVIKPEMEADFRRAIGDNISKHVELRYAYQQKNYVLTTAENNTLWAENVTFGAYKLNESQIHSIRSMEPVVVNLADNQLKAWDKACRDIHVRYNGPLPVAAQQVAQNVVNTVAADSTLAEIPDSVKTIVPDSVPQENKKDYDFVHQAGNVLYFGQSPTSPQVGDVRITFEKVVPAMITIMAKVSGDTFKSYKAKNGKTFSVVRMGKQDMDEIFESEHSQNHLFLWVLRILGVILVITGLKGIFDILSTVLKVVPFVANIVGWGVGVVCTVVGIVWSLIIIAIAWLFYRPLIGIILLAIAAFLIWVFAFKGKDKLKELAKRKDMQPEIQKI